MGYNRSEIARATGLSRPTISEILSNKQKNPKIETLEKIASVVGCSVDELRQQIKKEN